MKTHRKNDLILNLRKLAGQIGEMENDFPYAFDAENYDFHVKAGLAESVAEIFKYDTSEIIRWFLFCLTAAGVDLDPRVDALLDALVREIEALDTADGEADGG